MLEGTACPPMALQSDKSPMVGPEGALSERKNKGLQCQSCRSWLIDFIGIFEPLSNLGSVDV